MGSGRADTRTSACQAGLGADGRSGGLCSGKLAWRSGVYGQGWSGQDRTGQDRAAQRSAEQRKPPTIIQNRMTATTAGADRVSSKSCSGPMSQSRKNLAAPGPLIGQLAAWPTALLGIPTGTRVFTAMWKCLCSPQTRTLTCMWRRFPISDSIVTLTAKSTGELSIIWSSTVRPAPLYKTKLSPQSIALFSDSSSPCLRRHRVCSLPL